MRRFLITLLALLMLGTVSGRGLAQIAKADGPPKSDDPRIRGAELEKEALETKYKLLAKAGEGGTGFQKSLAALEKSLDALDGSAAAEKNVLEALKKATAELRAMIDPILARQGDFERSLTAYKTELRRAPAAFLAAAQVFDQRGDEEVDTPEFKDKYHRRATDLRNLAKTMEHRAELLDADIDELARGHKFVRSAAKYLASLDEFYGTFPAIGDAAGREDHIRELRKFIDAFRQLDAANQKFLDKLQKESPDPQARLKQRERAKAEQLAWMRAAEAEKLREFEDRCALVGYSDGEFAAVSAGSARGVRLGQRVKVYRDGVLVANAVVTLVEQKWCTVRYDSRLAARSGDRVPLDPGLAPPINAVASR